MTADQLLDAMFAAWVAGIDSVPLPDLPDITPSE